MGTPLFPFALTLLAAVSAAPDPQVMREERFQTVLSVMDVAAAEQACLDPRIANSDQRRQALRDRLLALHPVIDSLDLVLANAEALMSCGALEAAAVVLNRYSSRAGENDGSGCCCVGVPQPPGSSAGGLGAAPFGGR